ncbi:hypothetical protein LFM09_12925 [Lentzea alba]|uniref:hypothetical protein n=1 Tax=Lentzea alba TaxID=2714351 RepID=UPI0039BF43D6
MTDPQNPSPWQNPGNAQDMSQWQQFPVAPEPTSPYQVSHMGQASFSMAPLSPVLPQEMPPQRPSTITAAMWIWIAGAVLSVAVIPLLMFANVDAMIAGETGSDRQAAELGVQATAIMAGFGMLVAASPYVAFAIVLRNGHNWARIVLTLLGMLGIVTMISITIVGLQAPVWQVGVAMSIVVIGLTVAAVVLQFLPASNKYVR